MLYVSYWNWALLSIEKIVLQYTYIFFNFASAR